MDMAQLWISTIQEPCSVFFLYDIQSSGQGCALQSFFSVVHQIGCPRMNVDHVNYWAGALAVISRRGTLTPQCAQPGGHFRDVSAETVSANKLSASWSLLLSACTTQQFNLLSIEGQGKYEWYMMIRILVGPLCFKLLLSLWVCQESRSEG